MKQNNFSEVKITSHHLLFQAFSHFSCYQEKKSKLIIWYIGLTYSSSHYLSGAISLCLVYKIASMLTFFLCMEHLKLFPPQEFFISLPFPWEILLPNLPMAGFFLSFRYQLKCHFYHIMEVNPTLLLIFLST